MPADEDHPATCPNLSSVDRACDAFLRKRVTGYAARQDEKSAKMKKSHATRKAEKQSQPTNNDHDPIA